MLDMAQSVGYNDLVDHSGDISVLLVTRVAGVESLPRYSPFSWPDSG